MTAAAIKAARAKAGKSCREFAQQIGVSWRTLQGWEQGRTISPLGELILAKHGIGARIKKPDTAATACQQAEG